MGEFNYIGRLSRLADMSDEDRLAARIAAAQDHQDDILEAVPEFETRQELSDDAVMALISPEAFDFVVACEIGSRKEYDLKDCRPTWPGGASGVTIGIGYDIGVQAREVLYRVWDGLIPAAMLARLADAVGVTGPGAKALCAPLQDIVIAYDVALEAFKRDTLPNARDTLRVFPGSEKLAGNAFGSLFSLIYNRGTSLSGDRRRHMRAIRDHIAAGQYEQVPQDFRDMKVIWEGQHLPGLIARREGEAVLFEKGLKEHPELLHIASPESLEAVRDLEGDGRHWEYDNEATIAAARTLEAVQPWDGVTWVSDPNLCPDYRHLKDFSLRDKSFAFTPADLDLLLELNAFDPKPTNGKLIFALRGAALIASVDDPQPVDNQIGRDALTLKETTPDHTRFRCVIGVYDIMARKLSGYIASTVPCRRAVWGYASGLSASNMMATGLYHFTVGWHHTGTPRALPGVLTESDDQRTVRRSPKALQYGLKDVWDCGDPGDNLHPSFADRSAAFSSWGCLTVSGNYQAPANDRAHGTHTGEWARFREALGLKPTGTSDHGKTFDAVLLTGLDAAIASELRQSGRASDPAALKALTRLRHGSSGDRVKLLEAALGLPSTGKMTAPVVKAYTDLQKAKLELADGIHSPDMDDQLHFTVFSARVEVAQRTAPLESLAEPGAGLDEETDLYYELGMRSTLSGTDPEALSLERLPYAEGLLTDLSFSDVVALGKRSFLRIERSVYGILCGSEGDKEQRDKLASFMNAKVAAHEDWARAGIAGVITAAHFIPAAVALPVAHLIVKNVLKPFIGDAVGAGTDRICRYWAENLRETSPNSAPQAVAKPEEADPDLAKTEPAPFPASAAASASKASPYVDQVVTAADAGNWRETGRRLGELKQFLDETGTPLGEKDAYRLVGSLSGLGRFYLNRGDGKSTQSAIDEMIAAVDKASKLMPPDKAAIERTVQELEPFLNDATVAFQPPAPTNLLLGLRRGKAFGALSKTADKFITRGDDGPTIRRLYGQALIEEGHLGAAVDTLRALLASPNVPEAEQQEAQGLLGRAFKQMYVNYVKTAHEAATLKDRFGPVLQRAIQSYRTVYDPKNPRGTYWLGMNYAALLMRAQSDGIALGVTDDPAAVAKDIIGALEASPETPNDYWALATLGEAYFAIRDYKKAAEYYGQFARNADAFALNSAIRQLEQVWRIEAGPTDAGSILCALKALIASEKTQTLTLSASEQKAIRRSTAEDFRQTFETMLPDANVVRYETLRKIVQRASAVCMIRRMNLTPQGTGFLVNGKTLSSKLDDATYLLTNAHVISDPKAMEVGAISPEEACIFFEAEADDLLPARHSCEPQVVWQSPSSACDATLLKFSGPVPSANPLTIAEHPDLKVKDPDAHVDGSRLAVIGHPKGEALSLLIEGDINNTNGTLVDLGSRDASSDDPVFLHYMTPTEPGNSGSPVFETEKWQVVALHHAGFDPERGRPRLGGKSGSQRANEGISLQSIARAIDRDLPSK